MKTKILNVAVTIIVMILIAGIIYVSFKVDKILGYCALFISVGVICGNIIKEINQR